MLNFNSSSINNSHLNSFLFKPEAQDDDFNIIEEKSPNNFSMFISSSYISGEIQEIHDGSNIKDIEISSLNILGKKELDKSINIHNLSGEEIS